MTYYNSETLAWIIDENYEAMMRVFGAIESSGRKRTGDDFQFWAHGAALGDRGLMEILIIEAVDRYDNVCDYIS